MRSAWRQSGRRTPLAAFALSASLHAAVLALASLSFVPRHALRETIAVKLLPGTGPAGQPGGAADAENPGAAVRAEEPAPRAEPPHPQLRRRTARRPPHAAESAAAVVSGGDRGGSIGNETAAAGGAATGTGTRGATGGGGSGAAAGDGGAGSGNGDLKVYCSYCPPPVYPRLARMRGWSGRVDIEVALGTDGRVEEAQIKRSSGHEVLDEAAMRVARKSRFRLPAVPPLAAARGPITYEFRLSGE